MAKIFISYSSKDKVFATELANDLKELGHKPWLDQWEIKVGECIVSKIGEGVSQADYVVIVLTPDSVSSGWVDKEWKTAYWLEIEKNKIIVLPVLLTDCETPLLLKTKKYADFRKNYSIGLVQLTQSIVPADFEEDKTTLVRQSKDDREVSDLIAKVQGKKTPLSQCIAEALPLAKKYEDDNLVEFCKNELTGFKKEIIRAKEKVKRDYRSMEVFCSPNAVINPQYFGWGENASNMFLHMEQHPKEFFLRTMYATQPISVLEQEHPADLQKSYLSWSQPLADFIPDTKNIDAKVYCYARATAYETVVEAIRTEFTKRLLNLLPKMENL